MQYSSCMSTTRARSPLIWSPTLLLLTCRRPSLSRLARASLLGLLTSLALPCRLRETPVFLSPLFLAPHSSFLVSPTLLFAFSCGTSQLPDTAFQGEKECVGVHDLSADWVRLTLVATAELNRMNSGVLVQVQVMSKHCIVAIRTGLNNHKRFCLRCCRAKSSDPQSDMATRITRVGRRQELSPRGYCLCPGNLADMTFAIFDDVVECELGCVTSVFCSDIDAHLNIAGLNGVILACSVVLADVLGLPSFSGQVSAQSILDASWPNVCTR